MTDYTNAQYLERMEAQKKFKEQQARDRALDRLRASGRDPKWYKETVESETRDGWL